MNTISDRSLSVVGALLLTSAPALQSAEIIPINSFDPNTFFAGGILAGLDFNDDSDGSTPGNQYVTQEGFLGVPNSNSKTYNLTTNGITFDIVVTNANQGNQNRWRGNATAGALINDFEQWYGRFAEPGTPVEAAFTMSGLTPNTVYDFSFFTYNLGAGQTTHTFYEGTSSAAPLITTFTTSGSSSNFSTWKPGITFRINSGATGVVSVTVQATEGLNGALYDSRVTFDGLSIVPVGGVAPEVLEIGSIAYDSDTAEVTITFTGEPDTTYFCTSSTDLIDFSTAETPINGTDLTTDSNGAGSFTLSATGTRRFYRVESDPIIVVNSAE